MINWFKKDKEETKEITKENEVRGVSTDLITTDATLESNEAKSETAPVETIQPAQLTYKEAKALKKSRYEEIEKNPKYKNSYILLNTKTNQIVEIKAASSYHACNIIGWKSNKVKVLGVNNK